MKATDEFFTIGRCTAPDVWSNDIASKLNRLYYIHGGSGGYIQGGKAFEFEAKRLYLLPPFADVHVYSSLTDKIDHTYAAFDLIPPILSRNAISIDPHAKPEIESALGVFMSLCRNKLADTDAEMTKYLKHTVVYLSHKIAEENGSEVLKDNIIIKSLKIMHTETDKNLSISEIAAECDMSTDGFIRKFKHYIGQTPYEYLRQIKVRGALKMRELGGSWETIAENFGYADQASLLHAISAVKKKV